MVNTTLCYIEYGGAYLMMLRNKKKNDLNEGKWIGIGGKFLPGETKEECLVREVFEETGIRLSSYTYHGLIHFRSDKEDEEMYLFSARLGEGVLSKNEPPEIDSTKKESSEREYPEIECSEGTLKWIPKDEIMNLNLWEGDRIFLKKMIAGETDIELTLRYIGDKLIQ